MAKGFHVEYKVRNQTVQSFLEQYEKALAQHRFKIKFVDNDGDFIDHKAIFGNKAQAFFRSFIPLGSLEEKGNRYAAEAEMKQDGEDVHLDLFVVPYMTLFDFQDRFLISQGVFERLIDDERSKEKLLALVSTLRNAGLKLEEIPEKPDEEEKKGEEKKGEEKEDGKKE